MNKNKFTVIGIVLTTIVLAGIAIFTAIRLYQTRQTAIAPNVPSSRPNASGEICGGIAGTLCATGEECIYANGAKTAPTADATGVCAPISTGTKSACSLSFTLNVQTSTPTATSTSTATSTATATATATAVPECNTSCSSSADCPSGLTCYKPNGSTAGNCRNASCTTASNCFCATSTPTATATTTSTSIATTTPTATANPQCNYSCTSNSGCPSSMICYIPSGQTAGNCRNTQCLTETDCLCPNPTSTATSTPSLPVVGTSWPTLLGTSLGVLVIIGSLLLAL